MGINFHGIESEKVISEDEAQVVLQVHVPANCDFFDGHFEEYKILPAVGQFEILSRMAFKYFNLNGFVSKLSRVKFIEPIVPETDLQISLTHNEGKSSVSFVLSKVGDEEKIFSSGLFTYSEVSE